VILLSGHAWKNKMKKGKQTKSKQPGGTEAQKTNKK